MQGIVILAGAAMTASCFMVWVRLPFAVSFVPIDSLRGVLDTDAPWEIWAFGLSFVLAGLAALRALTGRPARVMALLAGATPYGLLVWSYVRAGQRLDDVNLGMPNLALDDLGQVWATLGDHVQWGFWAYFGGATVLLLVGIFGIRRQQPNGGV